MLRSCNILQSYSYNRPFEGSHNAEVALSENEFDTPALNECIISGCSILSPFSTVFEIVPVYVGSKI